jgi:hypothetical protein
VTLINVPGSLYKYMKVRQTDGHIWSKKYMALGLTQPLTEMTTRNLPGGKGLLAHKADNLTPSVS